MSERTFQRRPRGVVRMELQPGEAALLRDLRDDLHTYLQSPHDPTDPVHARLFPAAVAGDDEADAEVRRLLYDDLLASRLRGLDEVVAYLDRGQTHRGRLRVDLQDEEPILVLGVLNDLRLAIGARLGIETLDRDELGEDDPRLTTLAIMDYLGWWQEQLLAILDPASVRHQLDDEDDD